MARNQFIANRLREVLLNGTWIANTNYQKQLQDLDWQQAIQKIKGLNSIAELTFHINYYLDGILNVFNGGHLEITDAKSFDMPEITSKQDWQNLYSNLIDNSEKFIRHVEQMNDSQLDQPFVKDQYGSYLRNLEGVIEHSYYHLGQISLIKKIISNSH